ncbi:hypothetical protein CRM82_07430 [Comamonas terrigena]|uniref:Spore coat protein U/FanG domain-containing protein n=2 Tax=Comamonas terrigena TaxID=32013 RepID=A0A2A7UTD3_COMTR|nr:spore coat protein U domain-containing protein [Comamonas terrigena]PEH88456.1 hypothetical protein CRM82_07430 [Comamonas terrigena]SUY87901.1 Uncharacterized secreted protein [Comamonas terrigena]
MKREGIMKTKIIAALLALTAAQEIAGTAIVGNKASATLASSCQITAQSVNFGQIILTSAGSPKSATSNMTMYCTKGAQYTVMLNYGYVTSTMLNKAVVGDYYNFVNGVNVAWAGWLNPSNPPSGYVYDPTGKTTNFYLVSDYGTMQGATKGDDISHKITVPNNESSYWSGNASGHTYVDSGTGAIQKALLHNSS